MAKEGYVGVGGAVRKITALSANVDGAIRRIKKSYIGVSGVMRESWAEAPVVLPEMFEGTIAIPGRASWGSFTVTGSGSFELGAGAYTGTLSMGGGYTMSYYDSPILSAPQSVLDAIKHSDIEVDGNTYRDVIDASGTIGIGGELLVSNNPTKSTTVVVRLYMTGP